MSQKAYITPKVLKWARDTAGYKPEDVLAHLKLTRVSLETLEAWENGDDQPSYSQLKRLAKMYKRPVAVFYLSEEPDEEEISQKCRSLPEHYAEALPPEMRFLVRKATVRQMNLRELHGSFLPSDVADFRNRIAADPTDSVETLAIHVRDMLGISLEEQFSWRGNFDKANKKWRAVIENIGIWVFKDAFKQDGYSGFSLNDEHFPIIYVNNSTARQRQIFTMFHELAHIIRGHGGISFRQDIEHELQGAYRAEEVFCNKFAAEFLVPSDSLTDSGNFDDATFRALANKYSVSRRVILTRCLSKKFINRDFYSQKIEAWDEEDRKIEEARRAEKQKRKDAGQSDGGGSYYLTQRLYIGHKYLELAFSEYHNQRIDKYQLADYLGMKVSSLPEMESHMIAGGKV